MKLSEIRAGAVYAGGTEERPNGRTVTGLSRDRFGGLVSFSGDTSGRYFGGVGLMTLTAFARWAKWEVRL
jgi:hypothetical protein